MISGIGASLAGLAVFGKKLANAANNIANSNSLGFKRTEAVIKEDETGLPELGLERIEAPGALFQEQDGTLLELSNVDLAEELTETLIAQRGYEANLKALKAQNETLGKILDILV